MVLLACDMIIASLVSSYPSLKYVLYIDMRYHYKCKEKQYVQWKQNVHHFDKNCKNIIIRVTILV